MPHGPATIGAILALECAYAGHQQLRSLADQLRAKLPKLAALVVGAEDEVLWYTKFPKEHWLQIQSTNPLERLKAELKRRTNVLGIFLKDAAIIRLGASLLEQNDKWCMNRGCMQFEEIQGLTDTSLTRLPAVQQ